MQSTLAEQAELFRSELQGCLARVGSFLASAEATLGRVPVMPSVSPLTKSDADSVDEVKADIYGCFSPRLCTSPLSAASVTVSEATEAPVLHIMPELQEVCGKSPMVLPMEMGPLEALVVATVPSPPPSEPCQPGAFEDSGCSVVSASLTSVDRGHMVSLNDEVDDACVLAPNSDALFAKELCDLLVRLEAAIPGYGKDIACALAGEASAGVIMKVEKSLRRVRKKRRVARKA